MKPILPLWIWVGVAILTLVIITLQTPWVSRVWLSWLPAVIRNYLQPYFDPPPAVHPYRPDPNTLPKNEDVPIAERPALMLLRCLASAGHGIADVEHYLIRFIITFFLFVVITQMILIPLMLITGCSTQPPQVIVQQAPPPKPKIIIPDDPLAGLRPDVVAAIKSGNHQPLHDGISTIYEYSPDVQWTVDCAPMHATEIRLAADEATDNNSVILGDPARWSKKVSQQAVLVEPAGDFGYLDPTSQQQVPADPHMASTLTIVTSKRRSYHFLLRMRNKSTGAIEFRYPDDVKRQQAARDLALKEAAREGQQ